MADNEWDVWAALVQVVEADTSTGVGLVSITGKANPLVRWGDRGMRALPVAAGYMPVATPTRGPKDALWLDLQLDCYSESNNAGLAWKMADRFEVLLTHTNMASTARTNPVDIIGYLKSRRDLPELNEGRMRVMMEWDVRFNRT